MPQASSFLISLDDFSRAERVVVMMVMMMMMMVMVMLLSFMRTRIASVLDLSGSSFAEAEGAVVGSERIMATMMMKRMMMNVMSDGS